MTYAEIAAAARGRMGACHACPVCSGKACGNAMPGPGSKGGGVVAAQNFEAWQELSVLMDTIHEPWSPSTEVEVFGRRLSLPVMVAPVGDVERHYGDQLDMNTYNAQMLAAAAEAGTVSWTGDGLVASIHESACEHIDALGGRGIPTIKPWAMDLIHQKLVLALAARPMAIAMDIDGAGLPFLKGQEPPAGPKSVEQLREIADVCHGEDTPFILKGILSPRGAQKALEAGVDGIVVSNHGGRVQDGVVTTARALSKVAQEVAGEATILVDGGIRSGVDVFRALALGADAVLMCRPFVVCMYGAGQQGVVDYLGQLKGELADTMDMCGAATLADISADMVF